MTFLFFRDEDTDDESSRPQPSKNSRFEFHDEEEKEERVTSTTTTERRTKMTKKRSGKRLDLGAAASYAAEAQEDSPNTRVGLLTLLLRASPHEKYKISQF